MYACLSLEETQYFPPLILDYLNQNKKTTPFYNLFPSLENLGKQAEVKKKHYSAQQRKLLIQQLEHQNAHLELSTKTEKNIQTLADEYSFTITTGHQLNLFTGPLYFFYKIISVINLTEKFNAHNPDKKAVPIFWMASEDHDFEEINFFRYRNQTIQWQREDGGPVGRFSLNDMEQVAEEFERQLDSSKQATDLMQLFKQAYLEHDTLAEATRYLANQLFGPYGLVILGGDDTTLKNSFSAYIKDELLNHACDHNLQKTNSKLEKAGYHLQVHQREINLFYLKDNLRQRLIHHEDGFAVHDTEITFTESEILEELQEHPERFSPNAVMRPLYQEVVLPNLAYIGGAGELSYWLQLKAYFDDQNIPFPLVWLRNSALLLNEKQTKKINNLNREIADFFKSTSALRSLHTREVSEIDIDFSPQKERLKKQFSNLYDLAKKTDASFTGAVAAQEKKQLNGLDHLEKRLLKAQKRKLNDELERLTHLKEELFPQQNFQERVINFSAFYNQYGDNLIPQLKETLDPLKFDFSCILFKY